MEDFVDCLFDVQYYSFVTINTYDFDQISVMSHLSLIIETKSQVAH